MKGRADLHSPPRNRLVLYAGYRVPGISESALCSNKSLTLGTNLALYLVETSLQGRWKEIEQSWAQCCLPTLAELQIPPTEVKRDKGEECWGWPAHYL